MPHQNTDFVPAAQARILALAIFELRVLLSGALGSENPADPAVRQAAHLAYGLHNQALAVLRGDGFNTDDAVESLAVIDRLFEPGFVERFRRELAREA
jgi:hypothetical protein